MYSNCIIFVRYCYSILFIKTGVGDSLSSRITFGFMCVTGFLSMWLSNTATAAMMIPIAVAVLSELNTHRLSKRTTGSGGSSQENPGG